MSPLPDIAHWGAVEAIITSCQHVDAVTDGARHHNLGAVEVTDHRGLEPGPIQIEFIALEEDPAQVVDAIRQFDTRGRAHVLEVFHNDPSTTRLAELYNPLGYNLVSTVPILGCELPLPARGDISFVRKVKTIQELEWANQSLASEGESLAAQTLPVPNIQHFIAEMDGRAVAWAQLVTVYPGMGYVHQLFTLSSYRRRRIGSALIECAHLECGYRGLPQMVLVPTPMALPMYCRLGYRPMAYFSAFLPKEDEA